MTTTLGEAYKCETCGNVVEVINPGSGQLVCCGHPMVLTRLEDEKEHYESSS